MYSDTLMHTKRVRILCVNISLFPDKLTQAVLQGNFWTHPFCGLPEAAMRHKVDPTAAT